MANNPNLAKIGTEALQKIPKEKRVEHARKGRKTMAARTDFKEIFIDIMKNEWPEQGIAGIGLTGDDVRQILGKKSTDKVFISEAMSVAAQLRSMKDLTGNKAFEIWRDQIGQKPVTNEAAPTSALSDLAKALKGEAPDGLDEEEAYSGHSDQIPE